MRVCACARMRLRVGVRECASVQVSGTRVQVWCTPFRSLGSCLSWCFVAHARMQWDGMRAWGKVVEQ